MSSDYNTATIHSIHYLRGFAAWAVVFHHYNQFFYGFESSSSLGVFFSKHGDAGVDLFFIISGFIINYNFMAKSPGAASFAIDRITRIAPAYWLATCILVLIIELLKPPPGSLFQWSPENLALSLLFIPHENLSGIGLYPILTVGWTLNFEFFFYTLFFVSILLFRKAPGLLCLLLMLAAAAASGFGVLSGFYANGLYLSEFSLGIVLSILFIRYHVYIATMNAILRTVIVFILMAVAIRSLQLQYPGYQLPFSAAIVVTGLLLERFIRHLRGVTVGVLGFMGDISYSLYLYHSIVLFVAVHTIGVQSSLAGELAVLAVVCGVTTLVSWLSYRVMETRCRRQLRTLLLPLR